MATGRINGVATLTGFLYKKMYGGFTRIEESSSYNKVTGRWSSTVIINGNINL